MFQFQWVPVQELEVSHEITVNSRDRVVLQVIGLLVERLHTQEGGLIVTSLGLNQKYFHQENTDEDKVRGRNNKGDGQSGSDVISPEELPSL